MSRLISEETFFNDTFTIARYEDEVRLVDLEFGEDYHFNLPDNPTDTDLELAMGAAYETIVRQVQSGQYKNLFQE